MVAPIVTDGGEPSTPDFFVGVPEILDKVRKGGVVLKNDLDVEIADGEVNWLLVVGGSVFPNKIQVERRVLAVRPKRGSFQEANAIVVGGTSNESSWDVEDMLSFQQFF